MMIPWIALPGFYFWNAFMPCMFEECVPMISSYYQNIYIFDSKQVYPGKRSFTRFRSPLVVVSKQKFWLPQSNLIYESCWKFPYDLGPSTRKTKLCYGVFSLTLFESLNDGWLTEGTAKSRLLYILLKLNWDYTH